jgi:hypothetical protein
MTPQEFECIGKKLYGPKWKTKLANALKRHPSMIWRYVTGANEIPMVVELAIRSLLRDVK